MGFFRLSNASHSLLLLLSIISYFSIYQVHAKVFHLDNYGLVGGGKVDNSKALLKAWGDACGSKGKAQVEIPNGVYLTGPIQLKGPCKGPIRFRIKGTLRAPLGLKGTSFIDFQYVDRLTIDGGGSIDGQGRPKVGSPSLPALLRFSFVTNSNVEHISLKNSQSTHFHLFGCNNTMINQISISSPGDSPNTDGIKLGVSQHVTISDSHIASGDDCVAILTGTKNLTMTGVTCGPGHGFSIGSLGTIEGDHVEDVLVKNCTLIGTMNGVRIKSKATKNKGLVRNVVFRDIVLKNAVGNPIIIDQNYCPPRTCQKGNSRVQISDVKYINIKGTSKTNIAVDLDCSGSNPCQDIELKDIDITYEGPGGAGQTSSKCSFASGQASGVQVPKSCFS